MKVHCLFEQSGTFKNEFKKLGYEAEDYDILNDFGETDHIIDLYAQIRGGYSKEPSIFDDIKPDDLILAFFPCTRFESKIPLAFRGESYQQRNWTLSEKIDYSMKLHEELHRNYILISKLVKIALDRGLRLVIENPYTQPHYLTTYWCVKPSVIDKNRRDNGDYCVKPTQFYFINCEPKFNLVMEALDYVPKRVISDCKAGEQSRAVLRSMIHPQYARRFIKQYLIDDGQEETP
jgi:hypothetical protein